MSIFWSLKNVPELSRLAGKERERVHEACYRRHILYAPAPLRSVSSLFAFIFVSALFVSLGTPLLESLGVPFLWSVSVLSFFGACVGSFAAKCITIPALRPFYHEFIDTAENRTLPNV